MDRSIVSLVGSQGVASGASEFGQCATIESDPKGGMEMTDLNEAMQRLQQGDQDALEVVYRNLNRAVYFLVLSYVHRPSVAEDLTQDVFVQVYAKARLYQLHTNPKAWILTIARHLALNAIKHQAYEVLMDPKLQEQMMASYDLEWDEGSPTVELARTILSPESFQILSLILFAEFKRREVAALLKQPLPTITWKYHQALAQLRAALATNGKEPVQ